MALANQLNMPLNAIKESLLQPPDPTSAPPLRIKWIYLTFENEPVRLKTLAAQTDRVSWDV